MFGLPYSVQIFIFLKSIGLGVLFGAFFLLFSAVRFVIPHTAAAVFIEDLFFFCVCAVCTFLFLFAYNAGIPRFYVFFGESIGLLLAGTVLRGVFYAVFQKYISIKRKRISP